MRYQCVYCKKDLTLDPGSSNSGECSCSCCGNVMLWRVTEDVDFNWDEGIFSRNVLFEVWKKPGQRGWPGKELRTSDELDEVFRRLWPELYEYAICDDEVDNEVYSIHYDRKEQDVIFTHKPSGWVMTSYKKMFRSWQGNRPIKLEEAETIVRECAEFWRKQQQSVDNRSGK